MLSVVFISTILIHQRTPFLFAGRPLAPLLFFVCPAPQFYNRDFFAGDTQTFKVTRTREREREQTCGGLVHDAVRPATERVFEHGLEDDFADRSNVSDHVKVFLVAAEVQLVHHNTWSPAVQDEVDQQDCRGHGLVEREEFSAC